MSAPQFTKDAAGAKNSMHAAQQQAQNQAENIGARESKHVSHATGKSKLPEGVQKAVPEKVERIVPNKIHDTGEARVTDPNSTGTDAAKKKAQKLKGHGCLDIPDI